MKEIKLTQGLSTQVDDEDFEYLNQFKWYASKCRKTFYAQRGRKPIIKMHRVIMKTPDELQVDHINHNGLNNQKYNMRNCTQSENAKNHTPYGKSKYIGVCFNGSKYKRIVSAIRVNGKSIWLGSFKTEIEAAKTYDIAAKKYHGEFANLNFK